MKTFCQEHLGQNFVTTDLWAKIPDTPPFDVRRSDHMKRLTKDGQALGWFRPNGSRPMTGYYPTLEGIPVIPTNQNMTVFLIANTLES